MELEPTSVSLDALNAEIARIWQEDLSPETVADFVRRQGGSADDLSILRREAPVSLQYAGAPLDPATTAILITAAIGLGAKIAYDVWKEFILPRLKAKYGADKVKTRS